MRHRATTRRSSRASVRTSGGRKRLPASTRRSSSADTRTSSSTGASGTSGSSTPAASGCRTSASAVRTGHWATALTSSCGGRSTPPAISLSGRASGPRRRRTTRPSSSSGSHVASDTVVIGRVGKSHGLDGSFVVEGASESRELFATGAKLIVEGEEATVVGSKQARGRPVVRLDRRVARGAALEVPRSALAPTGDDEYDVFTLVPHAFAWLTEQRPVATVLGTGLDLRLLSYRDTTPLRAGEVDDEPYGGGAGMVLRVDVVAAALDAVYGGTPDHRVVALSPQGRQLTQDVVEELASEPRLTLLSARFEGFDERVVRHLASDAISIGPYVLSNGDLPAMVLVDAIARRLPGAIREESGAFESFSAELDGGLEYPHYTRPSEFRGWRVPEVLLTGDHARIESWRKEHVR